MLFVPRGQGIIMANLKLIQAAQPFVWGGT